LLACGEGEPRTGDVGGGPPGASAAPTASGPGGGNPGSSSDGGAPAPPAKGCGDIAGALPAWFSAAHEKDVWVANDGNDANDGATRATALATTSAAFKRLAPGVRLRFAEGTYGCASLAGFAGTKEKPGRLMSADGPRKAKFLCGGGAGLLLDDVHYLAIEGIEVANTSGHGIQLSSGAAGPWDPAKISNDLVLKDVYVHHTMLASFKGSQARGVTIVGSELAYASPGRQNIEFVAVDDVVVAGNEAHHSGAFDEFKGGAKNALFFRNYAHDFVDSGGNQTGMLVGGDGTGAQFLVHTDADAEATDVTFWGNVVVGGKHGAFRVVACKKCLVANNTFYHPGKPNAFVRVLTSTFGGTNVTLTNADVRIVNNVLFSTTPPPYVIPSNQLPASYVTMSHNAWFAATGDIGNVGSDVPFASGPSSLYADPGLTAPPGDLRPKPGSPLVGAGVPLPNVPAGFDGKCWSGAPNIGAY